jgi:hypothetical protein
MHVSAVLQRIKALMWREFTLMKRTIVVYKAKTLQVVVTSLVAATLFLRTHIHPVSPNDGQEIAGYCFFATLVMLFNGIAELSMTVSPSLALYLYSESWHQPTGIVSEFADIAVQGVKFGLYFQDLWHHFVPAACCMQESCCCDCFAHPCNILVANAEVCGCIRQILTIAHLAAGHMCLWFACLARDRLVSSSISIDLQQHDMAAAVSDVVACCLNGTFNCFFSLHLAVYRSDMCGPDQIPVTGFVSAASMATKAYANMFFAAFPRRRGYQYSGSRGTCCSLMLPPLPSPLSCSAFPSRSQRLWCGPSCLTSQLAWLVNLAGQLLQCSPTRHKFVSLALQITASGIHETCCVVQL